MAKTIKVTPEELERTAADIANAADHYKDLYEEFYTVTSSMADSWKGVDNMEFINRIDGFRQDFQNMYNEMVRYSNFLKSSAVTYRETQDTVVSQAKSLIN